MTDTISKIHQLFGHAVFETNIDLPFKEVNKILNYLQKEKYINHSNDLVNCSELTENKKILKKQKMLEKYIMSHFNYFKDNVLFFKNLKFKITTSWGTRSKIGSESEYHNHSNCWYSGVYYLQNDNSPIKFKNFNKLHSFFHEPENNNLYNSHVYTIEPKINTLIIFPHYLYHKIEKTNSERFSIAFNLMPVGNIGFQDSFIKLNHE
jgi:uncharacterized protein (TIGR02466 family)